MKFGQHLRTKLNESWAGLYLDYDELKSIIRRCSTGVGDARPARLSDPEALDRMGAQQATYKEYFFFRLYREAEKVNEFYESRHRDYAARTVALAEHIDAWVDGSRPRVFAVADLLSAVAVLTELCVELLNFCELNATGFRKILKKYHKYVGGEQSQEVLDGITQAFANTAVLEGVIAELADLKLRLALLAEVADVEQRQAPAFIRDDDVAALTAQAWWEPAAATTAAPPAIPTPQRQAGNGNGSGRANGRGAHVNANGSHNGNGTPPRASHGNGNSNGNGNGNGNGSGTHTITTPTKAMPRSRPVSPVPNPHPAEPTLDGRLQGVLLAACEAGAARVVQCTLERDAAVVEATEPLQSLTPLHLAARSGHTEILGLLLAALGPDAERRARLVDARDADGNTPLHLAARANMHACCSALLRAGATPATPNRAERSPLVLAVENGHAQSVEVLLACATCSASTLTSWADKWTGETLVMTAAGLGSARTLEALLGAGADPLAHNDQGETALHLACRSASLACVQQLAEHPALLDRRDKHLLRTPLFEAVLVGSLECTRCLLAAGASAAVHDVNAWTAHTHAVFLGLNAIAEQLREVRAPEPISDFVRLQNLDPTSFIDKEGELRARGHEKSVSISQREYGHTFVRLPTIAITLEATDLLSRGQRLKIKCFLRGQHEGAQSHLLPLADEPESVYTVEGLDEVTVVFEIRSLVDDSLVYSGATELADTRLQHTKCSLINVDLEYAGTVTFSSITIKPFRHPNMTEAGGLYWRSRKTLLIGHRGSGGHKATATTADQLHRTHVMENTILSFVTASSLGAEYVEFDVQLTADGVPVIFHNFHLDFHGFDIPVNRLTLAQFQEIKRRVVGHLDAPVGGSPAKAPSPVHRQAKTDDPPRSRPRAWSDPLAHSGNFAVADASSQTAALHWVRAPLTTLEETFKQTPSFLGFNIELKYPLPHDTAKDSLLPEELNHYVDTVLATVFEHAGERDIVFSSFHPDICRLTSQKQPKYPVLFLTESGVNNETHTDPRTRSLKAAVDWATANNLMGIVAKSDPLLLCPELIREVKRQGLLLLTWGDANNDVANARAQRDLGVDAVIADHIAHIRKGLSGHADE